MMTLVTQRLASSSFASSSFASRTRRKERPIVPPACLARAAASAPSDTPSCTKCRDTGSYACVQCKGAGYLPPGGFHAKNVVDMKNAVGTKWTAHRRTRGWRHFECIGASPKAKTLTLRATCDITVTVDIPVTFLKDRMEWSSGWKQRDDFEWVGDVDQPGGAVARPKGGATCVKCEGSGQIPCEAKGCDMGLVRIEKQRAVIERTEAIFKRQLDSLRKEDDEASIQRARMLKKQLNLKSDAKKERTRAEVERKRRQKLQINDDGSKWADFRNDRRDAELREWLAGALDDEPDPDSQQ